MTLATDTRNLLEEKLQSAEKMEDLDASLLAGRSRLTRQDRATLAIRIKGWSKEAECLRFALGRLE